MRAIVFVAWRELRRRWLATVAAALLVGLVGALVLATVAGARRSDSALQRFNAYSRSADVELTPNDLREIDAATSTITVQGHRYSEGSQRMIDR